MVHDRLRADLLFEDEPRDAEWALSMEPQIEQHVKHAGPDFSDLFVECRAASCRVIMEQPLHWTVPEHQAVLETVQESLEGLHRNPSAALRAGFHDYGLLSGVRDIAYQGVPA